MEREIRRLRKSLRQIESLERLDRELTSDEAQKVMRRAHGVHIFVLHVLVFVFRYLRKQQ